MRPEHRWRGTLLRWEHDGDLVDTFTLSVDGTEYDLGALTPVTGTTYEARVPAVAVTAGDHTIIIYAVNELGRTPSTPVVIAW
jgi:hypothetical protein